MQAALDDVDSVVGKGIGVKIEGVGLEGIHPPIMEAEDLAQKFQDKVVQEIQQNVAKLRAESGAIRALIQANGKADMAMIKAQSDYSDAVFDAKASAERFLVQNEAYASAERVFRMRAYLSALEDALADTRLYVFGVEGLDREHIRLSLEDPTSLDISEIGKFHQVNPDQY